MIWYLLFCSSVQNGFHCLPMQAMMSKEACHFVGKHQVAMTHRDYQRDSTYRCVGLSR